jgi:hypothetical protein
MASLLEYHKIMRRSISASVAVLGLFLSLSLSLSAFLVSSSQAQINGTPASVTSPGFGGRAINGTPASVTSLGPKGFSQNFSPTFVTNFPLNSGPHNRGDFFTNGPGFRRNGEHHHHHSRDFIPFYAGYYPVAVPYPADSANDTEDDSEDYQGGPTVFDRRGRGAEDYIPPVKNVPPAHDSAATASDTPDPEPAPEPTVLVFKDGHQLQVGNYAIVSQILYDLTPGHPRKVALADLDLEATQKQNEEHGIIFQLPPSAQAN